MSRSEFSNETTAVHGDRVHRLIRNGKEWYLKDRDLHQAEYAPLYSLFVPGSPDVRIVEEGGRKKAIYKGVLGAKRPNSADVANYKGLAQAVVMTHAMGYEDRRVGNALVDKDNNFLLIDYEFNEQMLTGALNPQNCQNILSGFIGGIGPEPELEKVVDSEEFQQELADAIVNFIAFPFHSIQGVLADRCQDPDFIIAVCKKKQEQLLQQIAKSSNTSLKERVRDRLMKKSSIEIDASFYHSRTLRGVDLDSFDCQPTQLEANRKWHRLTST